MQRERAGTTISQPFFPWTDYCGVWGLMPMVPAANQLASKWWPRPSPLGCWQMLAHSQWLRVTDNKGSSLDNHTVWRTTRSLDWTETNIESQRKWRNRGLCSKTKAQDKTPETDLNEMEVKDLPDRVQLMVIKMLRSGGKY